MNASATVRSAASHAVALKKGCESFRKRAWGSAFQQLAAADRAAPLAPDDLVLLAQSALLIGKEAEGVDALGRAHKAFLARGELQHAVRSAFWLGFTLLIAGKPARAGGWLSRADRLLEGQPDCVEKGYLLLPAAYRAAHGADAVAAHGIFVQAAAIGERFRDKDLMTLALQGQGRALIRQGEVARGIALLDEAMVAVTAGEISPLNTGAIFCSVLEACSETFDVQRAQEWTSALEQWCESQPDLVPYRGHCLVRRAELLQLRGAWPDALAWAQQASEWLALPSPNPMIGEAFYQIGEIQRLRGRFAEAEKAYSQASQWSQIPAPGLAQLRLAQGRTAVANTIIRRVAEQVQELGPRAKTLDVYVEIVLAAGDVAAARVAADELAAIAERQSVPFLRALAARASGAVLLAEGDAHAALIALRRSWFNWSELQAPYEAARVRLLMAAARRELGDEENARQELTAAREAFERLGAVVDLSRAVLLLPAERRKGGGPLTGREIEVLRLVASGMTNRRIGGKLDISEKTVARHLSNIFTKLDLDSRAAATAYAYEHDLIRA